LNVITEALPGDWRDLQVIVAAVLAECGFHVQTERPTATVRGVVEIDVYAEEQRHGRRIVVLCECKHWNTAVPQNIVHAFRTNVQDIGANIGYIIGSSGFQAGAYKAAELTNVQLLTWEQFQDEFENQWIANHVVPSIGDRYEEFLRWTEPLPPTAGRPLTKDEAERFWELWRSFQPLVALLMPLAPWMTLFNPTGTYPRLPLVPGEHPGLPTDVLESRGYRELLARVDTHAARAVETLKTAAFVS
jgi:hypothetical protein